MGFWKKNGFIVTIFISLFILLLLWFLPSEDYCFFRVDPKKAKKHHNLDKVLSDAYFEQAQPKESSGERECRRVLEEMFRRPFQKIRPDFLRNTVTESFNLELDCYNDELKLAVEYNGQQHYKYIPFFHKSTETFHNQKYRDYMKRNMCRENGITLIEIPYTVKVNDIDDAIRREVMRHRHLAKHVQSIF